MHRIPSRDLLTGKQEHQQIETNGEENHLCVG
jgi:hypothetical protein